MLKIGEEMFYFSDDNQYIFSADKRELALTLILKDDLKSLEENGIEKYSLKEGASSRINYDQTCKSEQRPKWYCQKTRVRGRMGAGAFLGCGNTCIVPHWDFETKSFGLSPYGVYLPVRANNRISYSFTASVTTELGTSSTYSLTQSTLTSQNSWLIETFAEINNPFDLGPNGTWTINDNGSSTHNLTRFVGNCSYNITCGLSF